MLANKLNEKYKVIKKENTQSARINYSAVFFEFSTNLFVSILTSINSSLKLLDLMSLLMPIIFHNMKKIWVWGEEQMGNKKDFFFRGG